MSPFGASMHGHRVATRAFAPVRVIMTPMSTAQNFGGNTNGAWCCPQ